LGATVGAVVACTLGLGGSTGKAGGIAGFFSSY